MPLQRPRILAISGSTRKNSSNASVLQFLKSNCAESATMEIFNEIDRLPHFNPDIDGEYPPDEVKQFRNKIASADAVVICTPEYVFSLPGSLKNAIEWAVSTTVFSNKPMGIIVAAASGEKAMESLRLIMTTIEAKIAEGCQLLVPGIKGKVNSDGTIKDAQLSSDLQLFNKSLLTSIVKKSG